MHVVLSALLAVLATFTMLLVNWFVVPWLNHAFVERGTATGLITDLVLSFVVAFSLMLIMLKRKRPHGLVIAVVMAVCGWTIYFIEVGYLPGMLDSEFPLWYELISFLKYPGAVGFALYTHKRGSNQSMKLTAGSSALNL